MDMPRIQIPIVLALLYTNLFLSFQSVTHAQSVAFTPIPAWAAASCYIEGKAFYIMAGTFSPDAKTDVALNQAFSIDLSTSWNVTNPKYTEMKQGIIGSRYPNALLKDGVTWLAIINKTVSTYNLNTGAITDLTTVPTFNNVTGLSAVMEPSSGDLIIPNGFNSTAGVLSSMKFTPGNPPIVSSLSPFSALTGLTQYSMAWSESTKSIYVFGGAIIGSFSARIMDVFMRFNTADSTWTTLPTTNGPTARRSSCMVSANQGAQLIVFGGTSSTDVALGDIYIYDVASSSWKRGQDGGARRTRGSHVCAMSGDLMVAWGGYVVATTAAPVTEMTAVFNLTSNTWVEQFTAPQTSSGSEGGSGGSNLGAIIGGAVGAIVVIAAIGFFVYRRKKNSQAIKDEGKPENDHSSQHELTQQGASQGHSAQHYQHASQSPGQDFHANLNHVPAPTSATSAPIIFGQSPTTYPVSPYSPPPPTTTEYAFQEQASSMSPTSAYNDQYAHLQTTLPSTSHLSATSSHVSTAFSPAQSPVVYDPTAHQQYQSHENKPQAQAQIYVPPAASTLSPQNPQALHYGYSHHYGHSGYGDDSQQQMEANESQFKELREQQQGRQNHPQYVDGHTFSGPGSQPSNPQFIDPLSTAAWTPISSTIRNPQQI
ncbi:hypothetical protein BGZ94_009654 [Podila epigama]|nr:hypothetical protein BGZ94_009654 [Podila epigama]